MDLTAAALLGSVLSYVVYITLAGWYLVPWLRKHTLAVAVTALLWVHAFRHVALQLFSAQEHGFTGSDAVVRQIAFGDLAGMILALGALFALRYRWRYAIPLVWIFLVVTVLDLGNAALQGVREELFGSAMDVAWMILVFYVPALWVSLVLIGWQLIVRRGEPLHGAAAGGVTSG